MREIEKKMIQAVNSKKDFSLSNTMVRVLKNGSIFAILYNTIIFASVNGSIYFSDGGYRTATTASRLRAFGTGYSTNEKKNKCKLTPQNYMIKLWNDNI